MTPPLPTEPDGADFSVVQRRAARDAAQRRERYHHLTTSLDEWAALAAAARVNDDARDRLDRLLDPGSPLHAALAEAHRPWRGGEDRGVARDPLEDERDDDSVDLAAASAILSVIRTLCGTGTRAQLRDAAEHWTRACLPSIGGPGHPSAARTTAVAMIDGVPGLPHRGLLTLLAWRLAGTEPRVTRMIRLPVLFDRTTTGARAFLCLRVLDAGPAGFHPDPVMAFLAADAPFADALRRAWRGSPLAGTGSCVTWAVLGEDGRPVNDLADGSLGGAVAVGLVELHRLRWRTSRVSPRRLDRRCALSAALDADGRELRPIAPSSLARKLRAAAEAGVSRVIVPTANADDARLAVRAPTAAGGRQIRVDAAATVAEAVRRTRITVNPAFAWPVAVVVILATAAGTLTGVLSSSEQAAHRRTVDAQRQATVRTLQEQAAGLAGHDPTTALRLGVAAARLDHGSPPSLAALRELLDATPTRRATVGHPSAVNRVAADPSRRLLLTGSGTSVHVWDTASSRPRQVGELPSHTSVNTFALGAGARLAANLDGHVWLWDLRDPSRPQRHTVLGGPATDLRFNADGGRLATVSNGGAAALWDTHDLDHPRRLLSLPAAVTSASVDKAVIGLDGDATTLALVSGGALRAWDITDPAHPRIIGVLPQPADQKAVTLALDPHAALLAVGYDDTTIRLWDLRLPTLTSPAATLPPSSAGVSDLAWSPDGAMLAVSRKPTGTGAAAKAATVVWDLRDPVRPRQAMTLPAQAAAVRLAFPDSDLLVVCDDEGTATEWRLPGRRRWSALRAARLSGDLTRVGVTADGSLAAVADPVDTVTLWDVTNPSNPRRHTAVHRGSNPDRGGYVQSVAFNPAGTVLAIGDASGFRLWDVRHPDSPVPLPGPANGTPGGSGSPEVSGRTEAAVLAFSPDGTVLVSGTQGVMRTWSLTGNTQPKLSGVLGGSNTVGLSDVTFGPDGSLMATVADQGTVVWDARNPARPVFRARMSTPGAQLARISPAGQVLATAGSNGTVTLWSVDDPTRPMSLFSFSAAVANLSSLTFTVGGSVLVVGGRDGSIDVWDVRRAARPRRLNAPMAVERGRAVTTLVTSDVGGGTLWNLADLASEVGNELVEACARAGRGLRESEWHDYLPDLPYQKTCTH